MTEQEAREAEVLLERLAGLEELLLVIPSSIPDESAAPNASEFISSEFDYIDMEKTRSQVASEIESLKATAAEWKDSVCRSRGVKGTDDSEWELDVERRSLKMTDGS